MMVTRTLKVRLDVSPEELSHARATISELKQVYAKHVDYALTHKTLSKKTHHDALYQSLRQQHPSLPSALLQSVRDVAVENLKAIHSAHPKKKWSVRPERSEYSAIRLDSRTVTLRGEQLTFSAIGKRIKTIIAVPGWFKERYPEAVFKAATLRYDKKTGSLIANLTYHTPSSPIIGESHGVVGLDRGLYSLVTTSEGEHYKASEVRAVRRRYLYTRRVLQQKGTPSAKRRLKALSGKEKRFMQDYNHVISKKLANNPTAQTYVLEDLTGIRAKRKGKKLNTWLSQWSFHQLETFLTYKCEYLGKTVVFIDPRYTSQRCNACGIIEKTNRVKNKYVCKHCGVMDHADINAAKNIRDLHILSLVQKPEQALVNEPYVTSLTA